LKQRCDAMRAALAAALVFSGVAACWSEGPMPATHGTAWQPLGAPNAVARAGATDAGGPANGAAGTGAPAAPPSDAAAPPSNDCCTPSSSGGCGDSALQACVCEGDAFCCTVEYDALCARQATSRCGLDCEARPPSSDCCGPSDVPGCTQPAALACICDIDPFCCVFRFDASCVNLAVARCGAACGSEDAQP
jgi:hypothetical protein